MEVVDCERDFFEVEIPVSNAAAAGGVLVSNIGGVYSSSMSKGVILKILERGRTGVVAAGSASFAKDAVAGSGAFK